MGRKGFPKRHCSLVWGAVIWMALKKSNDSFFTRMCLSRRSLLLWPRPRRFFPWEKVPDVPGFLLSAPSPPSGPGMVPAPCSSRLEALQPQFWPPRHCSEGWGKTTAPSRGPHSGARPPIVTPARCSGCPAPDLAPTGVVSATWFHGGLGLWHPHRSE